MGLPLGAASRLGKASDDIGGRAKHPALRRSVRSTVAPSIGRAGKARLSRVAQQTLRVCEVNEPPPQRRFAAWKSV